MQTKFIDYRTLPLMETNSSSSEEGLQTLSVRADRRRTSMPYLFLHFVLCFLLAPISGSDMPYEPSGIVSTLCYFSKYIFFASGTFIRPLLILFVLGIVPVLMSFHTPETAAKHSRANQEP